MTEEKILVQLNKLEEKLNHQPQVIIVLGGGRRKGALEAPIDCNKQIYPPQKKRIL